MTTDGVGPGASGRDEIRRQLEAILGTIAPEVDLGTVRPDVDLREELDIDSMDFLRLVIQVHERLGVEIPEADYARVRSLDGLVSYLAARLAPPQSGPDRSP
jgi:acyl carrier protein